VYALSASSVVLYTWLDCLDGKQARRTGTSSPLGQLFDHGCDALSVNLLLAMVGCSLGVGCGWAHALGNLGVSVVPWARQAASGAALGHTPTPTPLAQRYSEQGPGLGRAHATALV
jgi:phosphatidylglycerophosphate synthase